MLNQIYEKTESLLIFCEESEKFALILNLDTMIIENIKFSYSTLLNLKNDLDRVEKKIPDNYLNIFMSKLTDIGDHNLLKSFYSKFFYIFDVNKDMINPDHKSYILANINNLFANNSYFLKNIIDINFNIDMFGKFDYLSENIVAIGANGSGKSTLSEYLKNSFGENSQIISAQKLLIIPTFSSISSISDTQQKLRKYQQNTNNYKGSYKAENDDVYSFLNDVGGEFKALLDNLLAERIYLRNKYCDIKISNPNVSEEVPVTKLDKVLKIWNNLIQHRKIFCDGVNIYLQDDEDNNYQACLMSDGEKVALYLISHIIQAPKNGFIIVDEPEIYLNKSILNKLWDILEDERNDCIFMYLTHDVDFATTRYNAKKLWIKSFKFPNIWNIERIKNDTNLPENLLLELLGSRKNIMFCEGEIGKIDDSLYNILFPDFTIKPVGFCHSVINYTKAFNVLGITTTKAYGIIDSDHILPTRLERLEKDNIFCLDVAEVENLLLDPNFLKLLAIQFHVDNSSKVVDNIKEEIISDLDQKKDIQAANYVSSKINFYFKDSDISKGNNFQEISSNFNNFLSEINIEKEYNDRVDFLNNIINTKDYEKVLKVFNDKGLIRIVEKNLKIRSFKERAISFLKDNKDARDVLKEYFHKSIK